MEKLKHIIVYCLNDKVISDYNDVAHYLATAIELFRRVRNRQRAGDGQGYPRTRPLRFGVSAEFCE